MLVNFFCFLQVIDYYTSDFPRTAPLMFSETGQCQFIMTVPGKL